MIGIADADSVEHGPGSQNYLIVPVSCAAPSGPGAPKLSTPGRIRLKPGSLMARLCAAEEIQEEYFCNYEVNPAFRERIEAAGLAVTGVGPNEEVRALELPANRFFLATLFQPQLTSQASGQAHPLILAYLRAALKHSHARAGA